MALPIVETPTYELTLPSNDVKVKYRPFLVKEEKILMMSQEAGEQADITNTVVEILQACTFNEIDLKTMPMFDLEYLFLNVRARSVSELAKFKVLCPDDMKTQVDVEIDLTKVEVQVDDDHTNDILLDEERKLGVIFNYPNMGVLKGANVKEEMKIHEVFDLIISCIDHIYEGEKIYPAKDSTKQELSKFVESLKSEQFRKIQTFFDTAPTLKHEVEIENPNTKVKSKSVFKGLNDFFSSASPTTH